MNIWKILEIDETKDKKLIKKAYAKMIAKYHPEEYPEKFQDIQRAYEQAMSYASYYDEKSPNPSFSHSFKNKEASIDCNTKIINETLVEEQSDTLLSIAIKKQVQNNLDVERAIEAFDRIYDVDLVKERYSDFFESDLFNKVKHNPKFIDQLTNQFNKYKNSYTFNQIDYLLDLVCNILTTPEEIVLYDKLLNALVYMWDYKKYIEYAKYKPNNESPLKRKKIKVTKKLVRQEKASVSFKHLKVSAKMLLCLITGFIIISFLGSFFTQENKIDVESSSFINTTDKDNRLFINEYVEENYGGDFEVNDIDYNQNIAKALGNINGSLTVILISFKLNLDYQVIEITGITPLS